MKPLSQGVKSREGTEKSFIPKKERPEAAINSTQVLGERVIKGD